MSQHSLQTWLQTRSKHWQRLNELLSVQKDKRAQPLDEVLEIVQESRALARDVSLAKNILPNSNTSRSLDALFARSDDVIYRKPQSFWYELKKLIVVEVPQVMADLKNTFFATVGLFLLMAAAGWLLVWNYPEMVSLFASTTMVDFVQSGKLWTDDLLNVTPSSVLSVSIMTNNIVVSLFAFVLGALYGIGTLYIIGMNGFMLGCIFAFTAHYDLDGRLFNFVIAHGVVELTVICLAGAAGIRLGEAIIRPGDRSRVVAFQAAVSQAGKLLVVVSLFLVGAGLIEGYVSPNDAYPLSSRVVIGVGYGILLWTVLTGSIWKFGKEK